MVAFVFTSCAKQPTQQMDAAKAAIEAVAQAKGDIYAKDELKKLNDDLTVANDEVTAQSKKFFKKYGKAKEMLAKLVDRRRRRQGPHSRQDRGSQERRRPGPDRSQGRS